MSKHHRVCGCLTEDRGWHGRSQVEGYTDSVSPLLERSGGWEGLELRYRSIMRLSHRRSRLVRTPSRKMARAGSMSSLLEQADGAGWRCNLLHKRHSGEELDMKVAGGCFARN